jgi:hypothetical protein
MDVFKWLSIIVCAVLMMAGTAQSHWDPTYGDPYWMPSAAWNIQEVFLPGYTVCLEHSPLADDWKAKETGPVTDIHFWVAFWEDDIPQAWWADPNLILQNTTWDIAIYNSVNNMCNTAPWTAGWTYLPGMADMTIRRFPLQGTWVRDWHCPDTPYSQEDDHAAIFEINITNIKMPMIQTINQCYWLVMSAQCVDPNRPIGAERPVIGWCAANPVSNILEPAKYRDQYGNWMPIQIGSTICHGCGPQGEDIIIGGSTCDLAFVITGGTLDYSDAPDTYKTTNMNNGARHHIDTVNPQSNICLGSGPLNLDAENNGFPSVNADGDDLNMMDDEDGVVFMTSPLIAGQLASIRINVFDLGQQGRLNAWIDFNADGDFNDSGEQIAQCRQMVNGVNMLNVLIPANAAIGATYARFRYSTVCDLPYYGQAPNGEVEDYIITIREEDPPQENSDFGDAPDQPYPTRLASNGARHTIVPGMFMGATIDAEADGQPIPPANGDDLNALDDEDGVTFLSPLTIGKPAQVQVIVSMAGKLDAWIDFNRDGTWAMGSPEQIAVSIVVTPGVNVIPFNVPAGLSSGTTFARFRYSTAGGLAPTGGAPNGEVEDYMVNIEEEIPPQEDIDFGDAPQSYPTLLANNGARHLIVPGMFMGVTIDAEVDGQPTVPADGDDINPLGGTDDEDGVVFLTALTPGFPAQIQITVSAAGFIDAWIDFNRDSTWAMGSPEQIAVSIPVTPGVNMIPFNVPTGSSSGTTYARFRYSLAGGLNPFGRAENGEVEDYQVQLEGEVENAADLGDAPDSTNNKFFSMTAYPGVQANFPTVYIDALGTTPQGPIHRNARNIAYLGTGATYEVEADNGPDEDLVNNIDPANNAANQDNTDDSVLGMPLQLPYCDYTAFDYVVNIVSPALNQTLYVNVWFDWNRDGDWDDVLNPVCGQKTVAEWAVQNQVVTGLAPGSHTIRTNPFLCWHPILTPGAPKELWMRITLSETPWTSVSGVPGNGGSGPAAGYTLGETEDYLFVPNTSCTRCADLNCDGTVNLPDLAIFASRWLATCP